MKRKVIYELIEEDVQMVSEETLGRRLDATEISAIKDLIAENINWFDAIESAIIENKSKNYQTICEVKKYDELFLGAQS